MTNDPIYTLIFEDLTVADDGDQDMASVVSEDTSDDKAASSSPEEVHTETVAEAASQPGDETRRAGLGEATIDTNQPPITRSSMVPPPSEAVTSAAAEHPGEALSQEQLQKRASNMFCGGLEQLVASGGPIAASEVSLELNMAVNAVVTAVFEARGVQHAASHSP